MATLVDGAACVDPRLFYRSCVDGGIPAERWLGKANAFALEPGRGPGRGRVLLRKSDLDSLDPAADHALTFSGTGRYDPITLLYCTILSAECVTPGSASDPDAVYLVEVVDRRHHLGRVPLPDGYKGYNVSAADGATFLTATKNGATTWTWQGVVDDLVTTLGESTAAFALPFTPDNQPENLSFDGVGAWEALNRVLDRIACTAAYDPTTDTFAVVRLGVSQDAALDAVAAGKTWDGYPSEYARGWRPEKVRVRFLRRPQPTDGSSPYYTADVTLATGAGVKSGTYVVLDDDLTALGAAGTPTNSSFLNTRAQERADDWLRKRLYYERPVLTVWEDFLPDAAGLLAYAVNRIVFDDRGGPFQTAAAARPDGALEKFRPLGDWPPWWPFTTGTGGLSGGSTNQVAYWTSGTTLGFSPLTYDSTRTSYPLYSSDLQLSSSIAIGNVIVDGGGADRLVFRYISTGTPFPYAESSIYVGPLYASGYSINSGTVTSPNYLSGLTGTCTVKVSGVDKTMTIKGGIVTSIA